MPDAIQRAVDRRPNPEEQLIESEELTQEELFQQMEELFSEDSLASLIFSEWRRQTKGPESGRPGSYPQRIRHGRKENGSCDPGSAGREECPMSTDTNPSKMDLRKLVGNFAEAVEQASPEDLLAEAKAAGQNTEQIAADVKNTLLDGVLSCEQRKLHAARSAYRIRSTARPTRRFCHAGHSC